MTQGVRRGMNALYISGLALLSVLLVHALWIVPYLPTNDGPESIFAVHMQNHYRDEGTLYSAVFQPATQFASSGFTLLFGPLEEWFGWQTGLSVALSVIVLVSAWGVLTLAHALDPRRLVLGFLGFPLALSWGLYMGFFAFTLGSGIGLFVLALAVRWPSPSGLQRAVLSLLLLMQASCHVFSAVLTGLVLVALLVARASPRGRLRELSLTLLMGLPAVGVLVLSVLTARQGPPLPFAQDFVRLPLSIGLPALVRVITPGPWWRAVVVLLVLGFAVVWGVARLPSRTTSITDRALFTSGLVLLVAGVFAPVHVPGWQFFSVRFIPLGVLLCVLVLPVERLRSDGAVMGVAAVVLLACVGSLVVSAPFHKRLAAASADALAGLAAPIHRHGFWLPVMLSEEGGMPVDPRDSEVPFLMPLIHVSGLYATVQGGVVPYGFVTSTATNAFVLRGDTMRSPPVPSITEYWSAVESEAFTADPSYRLRIDDELATYGMFYEGVVVTGATPFDLHEWHKRGYYADWQAPSVLEGHFVPCPLDVKLSGLAPGARPLVDVGVGGQMIFRDEPGELHTGDRESHVLLPRAPCGDVEVRPHWEDRGSDGATRRRTCANASADGRIRATLQWDSAKVLCDAE